ncbi:MAG: response regulator [Roseobacter sp.]
MLASERALRNQPEDDKAVATILLVDDDFVSILTMRRVLKKLNISNRILVARDGQEALETLRSEIPRNPAIRAPFIVMLDMNMPRMSGGEFLQAAAADPALKDIVIFAFETTRVAGRKREAAQPNVSATLSKDAPAETLSRAIISSGCEPLLRYVTPQ